LFTARRRPSWGIEWRPRKKPPFSWATRTWYTLAKPRLEWTRPPRRGQVVNQPTASTPQSGSEWIRIERSLRLRQPQSGLRRIRRPRLPNGYLLACLKRAESRRDNTSLLECGVRVPCLRTVEGFQNGCFKHTARRQAKSFADHRTPT